MRTLHRVLIVEDDQLLARTTARTLKAAGLDPVVAFSAAEGLALLQQDIDLVVLDIQLPDGTGVGVAAHAVTLSPAPAIVVMTGSAGRSDVFALGRLGVGAFLEKPFTPGELLRAIAAAGDAGVGRLKPAQLVGAHALREVLDGVRTDMTREALLRAGGNKAGAARLLGITRQAVQQIERRQRGRALERASRT